MYDVTEMATLQLLADIGGFFLKRERKSLFHPEEEGGQEEERPLTVNAFDIGASMAKAEKVNARKHKKKINKKEWPAGEPDS